MMPSKRHMRRPYHSLGMDADFFGIPWWSVAVIVAAAVLGSFAGRSIGLARARRRAAEKLAQQADAAHEGANTRHEGGP